MWKVSEKKERETREVQKMAAASWSTLALGNYKPEGDMLWQVNLDQEFCLWGRGSTIGRWCSTPSQYIPHCGLRKWRDTNKRKKVYCPVSRDVGSCKNLTVLFFSFPITLLAYSMKTGLEKNKAIFNARVDFSTPCFAFRGREWVTVKHKLLSRWSWCCELAQERSFFFFLSPHPMTTIMTELRTSCERLWRDWI